MRKKVKAKILLELTSENTFNSILKGTGRDLVVLLMNALDRENPSNQVLTDLVAVAMTNLIENSKEREMDVVKEVIKETELHKSRKPND